MSAQDYTTMSTERLLALFIETAKATGTVASELPQALKAGPSEKLRRTPERDARVATMQALGAALRARKAIPEIRRLFEDEDLDVRTWAAGQFDGIDPDWASAAISGVFKNLPTADVLALRRRAREEPPSRPTLREMSDDALLARCEDAAVRLGATRFLDYVHDPEDLATRNRLIDEGTDILREIKSRGLLERLLPLLASANDTVRFRAAQGCLRIAEPQAVAALEEIAAKRNFEDSVWARGALDYWRKGKSLVDGL